MAEIGTSRRASNPAPLPRLVQRALGMAGVWMLFGIVVGSGSLWGNLLSTISGAIAGALILPWLGMVLGLLGGSVKDCLVGALAGAFFAGCFSMFRNGGIDAYNFNFGLLVGAMVGATFVLLIALKQRLRLRLKVRS
jgi:hypothetical protein